MKLQNIILAALGLAIIFIFFLRKTDGPISDDEAKRKIDSLNLVIQNEQKLRVKLDERIFSLNDSLKLYDKQLATNNQRLTNLKNKYNAKIDSISQLNSGQLQQFFSNRYGE